MYDIVIVGAGLSGLSAAHNLLRRDAKLKLLILEGKGWLIYLIFLLYRLYFALNRPTLYFCFVIVDRVGGRTLTQDVPAAGGVDRWDLGGQWVAR